MAFVAALDDPERFACTATIAAQTPMGCGNVGLTASAG
jgi:hypothetical protein